MKTVSCNDVSGMACDYVAKGESPEEAKDMLKQHGMEMHKDMMDNASEEQMKMMGEKMESMMKDE